MYPAGLVHFLKSHLQLRWDAVPKTCKTIRTHVEDVLPALLPVLKARADDLCTFRIEHRIKTYVPVDSVILAMHAQGMFSVLFFNCLLSTYLHGNGITIRPIPFSHYINNLEKILASAAANNTFASLPRGSSSSPPSYAQAAWAEILNATGLSHPSWCRLLHQPYTWQYRFRCDEDAAVRWGQGLQHFIDSAPDQHVEFIRTVLWDTHPKNKSMLILRSAPQPGKPPVVKGSGYYTIVEAAKKALSSYHPNSWQWRKDFMLQPQYSSSLFDRICRHANISLPPRPPFAIFHPSGNSSSKRKQPGEQLDSMLQVEEVLAAYKV